MREKPTVISLFSGAGGLDYGFEAAGFRTAVAIEMNHNCCQTLRLNRPSWQVIEDSIFEIKVEDILARAQLGKGEADVLIGGPPCQPFSKAGYWAHGDSMRLDDPRAETLAAYLRVVERAQPRVFVLENVFGINYSGKSEAIEFLLRRIKRINSKHGTQYQPYFTVLKAADFGVPQLRDRFFMVASRDGHEFSFPAPTHRPKAVASPAESSRLEEYTTAWDAIGDLKEPSDEELAVGGKWGDLLPSIPEGQNYRWHTDRFGGLPLFGWRRHYLTFLLKLAKNQPAWTLQAQPGSAIGPFHWNNRRLSTQEMCRLQTFPEDVRIVGGRTAVQRQLGNAVPSLLAEVIAREVKTQILGHRLASKKPRLLRTRLDGMPPPTPHTKVPRKYRDLLGEHEAHPGTGKGYGALRRTQGPQLELF